jgi:hypothetical protein
MVCHLIECRALALIYSVTGEWDPRRVHCTLTINRLVALDLGFTLISREMHGSNIALMLLLGLNRRQVILLPDVATAMAGEVICID